MEYAPPTIADTFWLFEVVPSKPVPVVDEGKGEPAEEGRPEMGGVESLPDEEVDDKFKVTGTFPRASGSRPTF